MGKGATVFAVKTNPAKGSDGGKDNGKGSGGGGKGSGGGAPSDGDAFMPDRKEGELVRNGNFTVRAVWANRIAVVLGEG